MPIGISASTAATSSPVAAPEAKPKSALRGRTAPASEHAQVNFNKKTKIYLVETLDEYTDEEYSSAFLTDFDHRAIQQGIVKTLEVIQRNNGLLPAEHASTLSSRGLEGMTNHAVMNQRKQAKANALLAVLNEQDRQGDADSFDDESMARVASSHSEGSRHEALARGARDAAEAAQAESLGQILNDALGISD